ncbi:hypothetical protein KBB49_03925 [Candidatus Saccharibacteria bacterium]|nr:hypothetical protein [Candidatus Saccharibacteria bacterium]
MKKQQIKATFSAVVIGILSPLAMAVPASAATATWAGHHPTGGYDGLAGTADNWVGSYAPLSGDSVVFGTSGINQIIELDAAHTVPVEGTPSLELASIVFSGDWSGTSSKSYTISSDNIINLSGNIESIMTGNAGDQQLKASVSLQTDSTFKTSGANTLSVGDTATTLNLGSKNLTLDANGGTLSLLGKITGTGNLIKSGNGRVNVQTSPGTGGFTGGFTVSNGELIATGNLGVVTVSGGTLKGGGVVGGITMTSGTVAPGNSPGVLFSGNVVFTGGTHAVELGGKGMAEFDVLAVSGTVNLGTETTLSLSLVNGFAPAVNDSFKIIDNDAADAVTGTFKGIADGAKVTLGSYTYQINYDGGDGNDVMLLVTGTPSAPDTGTGSIIGNPLATLALALLVAGVVAGYRVYEIKKVRR